ncbi:MAG: V-type ATP synthase subunit E family protein [Candidatus Asgardarchaeia archaeon]
MRSNLELMKEKILKRGREETDKILEKAEKEAEEIIRKAREEGEKEAEEIIRKAREEAERIKKSTISRLVFRERRNISIQMQKKVEGMINEIKERLKHIILGERFKDFLELCIKTAVESLGENSLRIVYDQVNVSIPDEVVEELRDKFGHVVIRMEPKKGLPPYTIILEDESGKKALDASIETIINSNLDEIIIMINKEVRSKMRLKMK